MEPKDERLWRIAKKRASFKRNLYSYISITIVLWIIWWFTADHSDKDRSWPWPMWVMIFWGIAILLEYFNAYGPGDKEKMTNDEYEKLKRNQ